MLLVFFFKQKTAYELRISDWSSDVCSSDLFRRAEGELCARRDTGGIDRAATCSRHSGSGAGGATAMRRQDGILPLAQGERKGSAPRCVSFPAPLRGEIARHVAQHWRIGRSSAGEMAGHARAREIGRAHV